MSKNKWFFVALVLVLALSACAAPAAEEAAPAAEEAAPAAEEAAPAAEEVDMSEVTIATCVKTIAANWFLRTETGLKDFAADTGATTFMCGPSKGDPAAQVGIIDEIIAQGVDGLCNIPMGVEEHNAIHKKAMDAGIPVVLHEAPQAAYANYDVEAFDNCAYGEEMMRELASRMGEEGVYVSFVGSLTNDSHMIWQECAYQYQLANYPNMTRLGLYDSKEDTEISYQTMKDLLKTHPEITGATGSSSSDPAGIGRAVEEAGLNDVVSVVGTSIPSNSGDLLKTGAVDLAMAWDPAAAGYACNRIIEYMLKGIEITDGMNLNMPEKYPGYESVTLSEGPNGITVVTGSAWIKITPENMDQYPF